MTYKEPICFKCDHYDVNTATCTAFPKEIPDEIYLGNNDHSKPLRGQGNNIVFERGNIIITEKIVFPICFNCKHYNGGASYTCKAFPEVIPDVILLGKKKHNKPLPNQGNDFVFEPS